ncbi:MULTISPECIES: PTS sugar transporter subunit IIA [Selenomonas]|uniref:Phosphoenolpyruvate-dependent sugar phosphotransferase system, EIIA 2 n=1 Tax=Selenomonas flueggei ATCC 43531 TaxID=638302 RepID=C4V3X3_9FIRM|nr:MULTISPECIES: PTS sugar transporter subunit IIA [Selenomonas]AME03085.1 PTS glucose transporter subunit IIBC [Selenomonas sp. oral taxon 136]EEQ48237.1 phosphoenolpyruvate-dependent sugar phosphotransferase system, EIIA 2 [Selenomonas flueggei ATCC 43531]
MDVALNEDLVLMEVDAKDKFDLLRQAAQCLQTHGYVKESYADAVIEREKVFATGLPTVMGGVAIPHTDVEHVNTPAVCIVRLKKPVDFVIMGDDTETVSVDCIFMLAMKEAHAQLTLLQNLMGILQDADALKLVKEGTSAKEICAFVKGRLSQVAE